MKLFWIFFLFNSITIIGQSNSWKSIIDSNYTIEYPNDWKLNNSGQLSTKFILYSPLTTDKDKFRENINLIVQDLTGYNMTLDKYVEISKNQISMMITYGNIISNERVKKDKREYHKIIYSGKQGVFDLQFEQYFWVIENNAYVLSLTCEKSEFENYRSIGEKILNSFNIK